MSARERRHAPEVGLRIFGAGFTRSAERMVLRNAGSQRLALPATVAVIEHPTHGVALFDTGYSERFPEITARFPERLYAMATPVTISPEHTARAWLSAVGIDAESVRTVILSHFHADHIGGVEDFPKARYVYSRRAYDAVRSLRGFRAVRHGFMPALLPDDFEARSEPLDAAGLTTGLFDHGPFADGFDIFGDGSVTAVELPGHAEGHLGLFVRARGATYFFVGDACWQSRSFRERVMPHALTGLLHASMSQYRRTLEQIHTLWRSSPETRIVPCHCAEALGRYGDEAGATAEAGPPAEAAG